MNYEELKIFNDILELMEVKKNNKPEFYNNDETKYLCKNEIYVTNNVRKGLIMLKIDNKYIVDIYVDGGSDNLINGLLDSTFDDYETAKAEYDSLLNYVNDSNLMKILSDGKTQILKCA